LYVLVVEGTTLLEQRRYRIPEVKMIPSNLNRCRFEILENNKQTRESTALSVAYNVERWRRGWEGIVGRHNVDVSVQLLLEVGRPARSQTAA
jgi:hypothetical protein